MARYPAWAQTTPLVTWIIKGKPGNSIWSWEGQTGCLSSYIHKQLPAGGVRGPSQRSCTIIDKDGTSGWRWTAVQLPIKTNESWCVTHLSWSSERMSKGWDIMVSSWLCKPFSWEINSKSTLVHRQLYSTVPGLLLPHVAYPTLHSTDPGPKLHNPAWSSDLVLCGLKGISLLSSSLKTRFRNQMKSFAITLMFCLSVPTTVDQ